MIAVLFVCLGNICRSPAAEGILRSRVARDPILKDKVTIESCGMGDWHIGQLPDTRIRETAKRRGVILASRAQQFHPSFFDRFDYILAVDHEVVNDLHRYATTPQQKSKIQLITHYSTAFKNEEIPDPYYKGEAAFELVLDMIEDSCEGFIEYLKPIIAP